jgi:hypothetical protein
MQVHLFVHCSWERNREEHGSMEQQTTFGMAWIRLTDQVGWQART